MSLLVLLICGILTIFSRFATRHRIPEIRKFRLDVIDQENSQHMRKIHRKTNTWWNSKTALIEQKKSINLDDKGPCSMKSEVVKTLKNMRRKEATGDDNVPAKLLKKLGHYDLTKLTELLNKYYFLMACEWPRDFLDMRVIAFQKKIQAHIGNQDRILSRIQDK